jgi:hypothetical protein
VTFPFQDSSDEKMLVLPMYNLRRNYESRYAMTFGGDYGYKNGAEAQFKCSVKKYLKDEHQISHQK